MHLQSCTIATGVMTSHCHLWQLLLTAKQKLVICPPSCAQHKERGGRERERLPDPRELDRLQGRARLRLGEELSYQEMLPAVLRNYAQVTWEAQLA